MKTDYETIRVTLKEGVAILAIDNPPVNQMSPQMVMDFKEAMDEAYADDEVKAIVLTGTGRNFIAGADITVIQDVKDKEDIFPKALAAARFLNSIESGPKPLVAAINGNCLGGGLETAMSCHYRVAAKGVNLGQPEVQIGLIPGAGGTQRLPRLIGLPNALEMITVGKPIKSEKAHQRGLVDELVDQEERLIETAVAVTLEPGDVIFFSCRTFHAAGKNLTDRVKLSFVSTYHTRSNRPIPSTRSAQYPSVPL